jgi:hypothetical protein
LDETLAGYSCGNSAGFLPTSLFSLIAQAPVTQAPLLRCNRKSKGECENIAVNTGITPETTVLQSLGLLRISNAALVRASDAVAMTVSTSIAMSEGK